MITDAKLRACALGMAAWLAGFGSAPGEAARRGVTVIEDVTIVDTHDGSLHPHRSIVLDGDQISGIVPAGTNMPRGARVIRESGRYVVPGFLDMHAHPLEPSGPRISPPTMVAYGVTGYRQMGGSPKLLDERKKGLLPQGTVPELLAMPGLVLASPALSADPKAAAKEVDAQKAEGADFIKVVDLAPPSFFAAMTEAHRLGLPFVGHLPPTIDVRVAAREGMHSIEHLGPNASILEACSTDEQAIRAGYSAVTTDGGKIAFNLPPEKLKRLTANPLLLGGPRNFALYAHILDTYDEGKCRALASYLATLDSWQVPTLIREKSMEFGNDPAFRDDPRLRFVPAADRLLWSEVGQDFDERLSAGDKTTLARMFDRQMKLVKLFDDAGVKMMAGSDMGGVWLIGGVSLHQEFDLLAQAGLSPLHILQMTTINGARFLHRDDRMGSVEVGKRADLVILDGNPIASVANLHAIHAVVLRGDYLSRKQLDAIEEQVAGMARH